METKLKMKAFGLFIVLGMLMNSAPGGPITGAACTAACAAGVVTCYSAAGFVFGTVTAGVGTPAVILGCNSAFSSCMTACVAVTLNPLCP